MGIWTSGEGFLTERKIQINEPITATTRQEHKVNQRILYRKEYYFYLIGYAGGLNMGAKDAYPVFPNFQNYVFPHGKLPDSFKQAKFLPQIRCPNVNKFDQGASAAWQRDGRCIVSGDTYRKHIFGAHLIPKKAGPWFLSRKMIRYGRNEALSLEPDGVKQTFDVANLISVTTLLKFGMDNEQFAVVPKSGGLWRTHVFGDSPKITPYHNVPIQHQKFAEGHLDLDVSPECLLARLALTLFAYNGNFFTVRARNTLIYNSVTCESEAKILSPGELRKQETFHQHGHGSSTVCSSTQASVIEGLEQVEEMSSFDRVEHWLGFEEEPLIS